MACDNPPVINVIKADIATAIMAPMYGIILNKPIKNPNNGAYLIPIKVIAIVVIIPTTTASKNWLATNLKNISFEL